MWCIPVVEVAGWRGRVNQNKEPSSFFALHPMLPCISWHSRLQMVRPSPDPLNLRSL
jgi:hypothetical protein